MLSNYYSPGEPPLKTHLKPMIDLLDRMNRLPEIQAGELLSQLDQVQSGLDAIRLAVMSNWGTQLKAEEPEQTELYLVGDSNDLLGKYGPAVWPS